MKAFLNPKSVAIVGASESAGKVGRTLSHNLIHSSFNGDIYPINPKRETIFGKKTYPSVDAVSKPIDLVVIATPAKTVPDVMRACARANIKAVVIISAGFKEAGEPGIALEKEILAIAKESDIRIIGPNCLGIMHPAIDLNASFAARQPQSGSIAFISQSGALCTAVLDRSEEESIGFSAFISIGSMLDIDWGDLIQYFLDDPETKSIFIYMESIGNAKSFLDAAALAIGKKPIVVLKAGKTDEAAAAAASHTGSLTGSDAAITAAFKQTGVLRIDTISQFFDLAQFLSHQPVPEGNQLTIITNAGGPGVLSTDALIESGGALTELDPKIIDRLDQVLPEHWSRSNPVDVLGDASAEIYNKTLSILAEDAHANGLLVILTPQDMTDATKTAKHLAEAAKKIKKPVLASWLGGTDVAEGKAILKKAGIASFDYPDSAARAFAQMAQKPIADRGSSLKSQIESQKIDAIFKAVREEKRKILTEFESKEVLRFAGIPVVQTYTAQSTEEAVQLAEKCSFPVVLKLLSRTITHKSDVGGVQLNLKSPEEVKAAFETIQSNVQPQDFEGVTVQQMITFEGTELILGSSLDPQLGSVILFGAGGKLVEVFKDSSLGLAPLSYAFAKEMIDSTKISAALGGVRGEEGIDMEKLIHLLVSFSRLIANYPCIEECDINPLLASSKGLIALDGRIVLI